MLDDGPSSSIIHGTRHVRYWNTHCGYLFLCCLDGDDDVLFIDVKCLSRVHVWQGASFKNWNYHCIDK